MKCTDDYSAKLRLWAAKPMVARLPELDLSSLPRFGVKRFDSYEALNSWKRGYLIEIARHGGVRWKKSSGD
jgi:hypothetical protein